MSSLQVLNDNQYEVGADINVGGQLGHLDGRLDHLVENENFEAEDLADLLQRAKAAGISLEQDPRVQDLFSRFLEEFESRKHQYANNSWRQLQYAWGKFSKWCDEQQLTALPATAKTVERYSLAMATEMHRNSLNLLLWAVRTIHVKAGCNDPTATAVVKDNMKAVRRKKVEGGESVKQATALRQADLDVLEKQWGAGDTVKHQRDWLTLNLAYETLTRKSELARIRVSDIEVIEDGSGVVTLQWTKTNTSGEAEVSPITPAVVNLINTYLLANNIGWDSKDYLLRPLTRYGKLQVRSSSPLSSPAIDKIFKEAWDVVLPHRPVLMNKSPFSGHSCRVGAAQDLLSMGYTIPGIMQSGRWKSEVMVLRYCRNIMAQEGAMFKMRQALSNT